ncbi:hypothetical protein [Methylobrevis pamukkalensis]|uniref:N-ethylmaleimide reductase n=1 Tax=Methylobrevis pamukkalensis TaxID=1439726 RepID=A0A1E3H5D7_9HYPH|nr:hypothetical protein [Methylobrevis pamukkalensis]ODN71524.1 N-ethylmaleimide reductase [Methylobrevis pamukkalensis]
MNRILTPINIGAFELANRRVHSADEDDTAAALPGSLHFAPLVVARDDRRSPESAAAPDAPPFGEMVGAIRARKGIAVSRLAQSGRAADEPPIPPVGLDRLLAAFATAARRSIGAGFAGVEIDGTDLCTHVAGMEAGSQLLVEIVEAVAAECPRERLGVRLAPLACGANGAVDIVALHVALLGALNDLEIAFVHLRLPPQARTSTSFFPGDSDGRFRSAFRNSLILSGGLDARSAEEALARRFADAVGFAGEPVDT